MAQILSRKRWLPLALALCLPLAAAGCALLIPPSWRSQGPIPLTGPIGAADPANPAARREHEALAALSDEELQALVEADERRLVELASEPSSPQPSPQEPSPQEPSPQESSPPEASSQAAAQLREQELRAIANRLPLAQQELEMRGVGGAGSRIRHPVIQ